MGGFNKFFNKKARLILNRAIIICLLISFLFLGFSIASAIDYNEELNLEINQSTEYNWVPQNQGEITSLKLNGIISSGNGKAYIENNDEKYLIFSLTNNNTDETNFNLCNESCVLNGFNKSSYKLIFELEEGTTIKINKILYSLEEEISETKNNVVEENQTFNETESNNFTLPDNQTIENPDNERNC